MSIIRDPLDVACVMEVTECVQTVNDPPVDADGPNQWWKLTATLNDEQLVWSYYHPVPVGTYLFVTIEELPARDAAPTPRVGF